MALLLSSERPSTAAATLNPFRIAVAFVGKLRVANARRQAFHNLLALDANRLDDLGINRNDLFEAMQAEPHRRSRVLNDSRARRASDWLNP
jgi:uncharacterized protein YjiS (DUF1127 family)